MSQELKDKIADIFSPLKGNPVAVEAVVGILEGEIWDGLDFPHQLHHNFRVYNDARCIAALCHSEAWEINLLEKGALIHDLGRNFVEMSLIKEKEHENGSFVLSKAVAILEWGFETDLANYFAEGIALHTKDVLPKKTDNWIRILRDSDRTSRLGVGGIIELAWYLGYRDEYIKRADFKQIIEDSLLFDSSVPTTQNQINMYDDKPRTYFDKKILPWIVENNKLQQLVDRVNIFVDRIYGIPNSKTLSRRWKIEPVSKEAQFLAMPRVISMNRFLKSNNFNEIVIP